MGERIRVQTYSGFKADERPISFNAGERDLQIRNISDRWYELDHNYFRVVADDGVTYLLRHELQVDGWELMEARRNGASAPLSPGHTDEKAGQPLIQKITPFLWFDDRAEEATSFYTSILPHSGIVSLTRYEQEGAEVSGRPPGSVMTVVFRLAGQEFIALNGGPYFTFTEAISFVVNCESQDEVDYYWEKLSEGGDETAQQCGWLKDKYGVSWQVVPTNLGELLAGPDTGKSRRAMKALLHMKKIDMEGLRRAAEDVA